MLPQRVQQAARRPSGAPLRTQAKPDIDIAARKLGLNLDRSSGQYRRRLPSSADAQDR
jgi:hypothetical protein